MRMIKRISIISIEAGIELYNRDFSSSFFVEHDNQLVSGFISALIGFSQSVVKDDIQEIVFSNSRLFFKRLSRVVIVLMTTLKFDTDYINKVINDLGERINSKMKFPVNMDIISQEFFPIFEELISQTMNSVKYDSYIQPISGEVPKIVLAGLPLAGKTTAIRKFFYSWNEDQLNTINPTIDYTIFHSSIDIIRTDLKIFDLGGQTPYRNKHLIMETRWREAAAIIFMVDIQQPDEFPQALEYLMQIVDILKSNNEEPFIGLFAHKYDPELITELKPNLQEFLKVFREILEWPHYSIFLSSIFDESLYLAFMRTIIRAIPRRLLQNILESSIFFETKNKVWETISKETSNNIDHQKLHEKIINLSAPYGEKLASDILNDWLTSSSKTLEIKSLESSLKVEVEDTQNGLNINVKLPTDENIKVILAVIEGLFSGLGNFFGFTNIERLKTDETKDIVYANWRLTEL